MDSDFFPECGFSLYALGMSGYCTVHGQEVVADCGSAIILLFFSFFRDSKVNFWYYYKHTLPTEFSFLLFFLVLSDPFKLKTTFVVSASLMTAKRRDLNQPTWGCIWLCMFYSLRHWERGHTHASCCTALSGSPDARNSLPHGCGPRRSRQVRYQALCYSLFVLHTFLTTINASCFEVFFFYFN